jgi:hypothetical protein
MLCITDHKADVWLHGVVMEGMEVWGVESYVPGSSSTRDDAIGRQDCKQWD